MWDHFAEVPRFSAYLESYERDQNTLIEKKNYLKSLPTICGPAHASGNNVPLPELPEAVVKAAESAVPGISFIKAERLQSGGVVVYELEGYADAQEYEIKVDEAGKVLTVEKDND